MIDHRLTGATIISRMNPSSRSHTRDAALKMALNTSAMQRIPGNMNVVRSTPSVEPADSDCRPGPRTNRNSSGWSIHVRIILGSSAKRMRSRRHTTRTARPSDRQERSGTRTATMSAIVALTGPPSFRECSDRGPQ